MVVMVVMVVVSIMMVIFILPGMTNSGISFRTSDLLRNILLGFDRRSDVGVGVECFL
jgi:type II secretory pathway component PulF